MKQLITLIATIATATAFAAEPAKAPATATAASAPAPAATAPAKKDEKKAKQEVAKTDATDRKSTRLNSSHVALSRMPSSA